MLHANQLFKSQNEESCTAKSSCSRSTKVVANVSLVKKIVMQGILVEDNTTNVSMMVLNFF